MSWGLNLFHIVGFRTSKEVVKTQGTDMMCVDLGVSNGKFTE